MNALEMLSEGVSNSGDIRKKDLRFDRIISHVTSRSCILGVLSHVFVGARVQTALQRNFIGVLAQLDILVAKRLVSPRHARELGLRKSLFDSESGLSSLLPTLINIG